MPELQVGVKELKTRLSHYLRDEVLSLQNAENLSDRLSQGIPLYRIELRC